VAIKPTGGHLDWITDDDANKFIEPSSAKRLQGWIKDEKPPFQYFNWSWRLIDRWLKWVEAQCDENSGAITALIAAPVVPAGTVMLFVQSAAPVGWTKVTTHNDKALRVVNGTAGSGGSLAFSTAMAASRASSSVAASGSVGNTTLTTTQMPSHPHDTVADASSASGLTTSNHVSRAGNIYGGEQNYTLAGSGATPTLGPSQSVGGGGSHNHSFTGTAHQHTLNMSVQYVDVIIATKD